MKKFLIVLFMVGIMLAACAPKADSASLTGTWRLKSIGPTDAPQPAAPGIDATLTFDKEGRMNGNVGCNSFGGDYKLAGDKITFGPIMSTMMACAEPQMTQEQITLQILNESVSYKLDGNTLTIARDGAVLVLEADSAK